jgi:hypothetical protein
MACSAGKVMELTFRVLCYKEDGFCVAHCLETDLMGHGKTMDEARKDLADLMGMQITFAMQRNEMSLLDHPADPEIFEKFNEAQRAAVKNINSQKRNKYIPWFLPFDRDMESGSFRPVPA